MMKLVLALALLNVQSAAQYVGGGCVDHSWAKKDNLEKDCTWVAEYAEKRCYVKGYIDESGDIMMASEGCPATCNACEVNPCADAPLRSDLGNLPCIDADVQSAIDVSEGAVGMLDTTLDPIPDYNAAGMCTVNVHWHIGAEHRSEGEYDETFAFDHPALSHRRLAEEDDMRVGHMCREAKEMFDSGDELVANEYDWKYCTDMHVGISYEFHWPHSSLGLCQTEWQFQEPFMDGVLCQATILGLDAATAVEAVFSGGVGIGVEGQVFTVVNSAVPSSSEYYYPTWDTIQGWNKDLAEGNVAYYQGSTTGDAANNDDQCRGTGGMVTWHQDRKCHNIEAATLDNLCRLMMTVSHDDMSYDLGPHGARETVIPELSSGWSSTP